MIASKASTSSIFIELDFPNLTAGDSTVTLAIHKFDSKCPHSYHNINLCKQLSGSSLQHQSLPRQVDFRQASLDENAYKYELHLQSSPCS